MDRANTKAGSAHGRTWRRQPAQPKAGARVTTERAAAGMAAFAVPPGWCGSDDSKAAFQEPAKLPKPARRRKQASRLRRARWRPQAGIHHFQRIE